MKKNLVRLFVALLALVILCTQLPLGYLATADSADEPPEEYPIRTVYKLMADMDYMGIIPKAEQTETPFINAVDFTSPDYDCFEFDLYVDTGSAFSGTIEIAIYDEGGNQATYTLTGVEAYRWLDIKINIDDFTNNGIDFTKAIGYRINNPESYIKYVFANLCFTGIKAPNDILDGDLDRLNKRIDIIDDNASSSQSDVISFDDGLESVDIYDKDWVEFDIYVLGTGTDPVSVTPSITFVDAEYGPSSKFGRNTATLALTAKNGFELKTNEWNHIKVPSRNFTPKSCDTSDIVGVMIAGTVNDYRYVVTNLALKTAVVIAPESDDNVSFVIPDVYYETYSETDNSAGEYTDFTATDFSDADYVKIDVYSDAAAADIQNLKVNLKDVNGKIATASFKLAPNGWVRVKILKEAFTLQSGFDMTQVVASNISGLSKTARYFTANLRKGYANHMFKDEYPEEATLKFDTFEYDYFAAVGDTLATDSLVNFDTTDFSQYDYVEFDVVADTQIDSGELPEKLNFSFVDANNRVIKASRNYTYNEVGHYRILVSALSPASGASLKTIKGIYLTDAVENSRYVIKNFCLTKIVAPAAPTKDVLFTVKEYADVTTRYNQFFDNAITLDDLDSDWNTEADAYDFSEAEYIEFDYYMVVDEESAAYKPSYGISMMLYDRNADKHVTEKGRARGSFTTNTNEWTHVRILLSSFAPQNNNEIDMTKICRFFFDGSQKGARSIIANMVVGKRATLPLDEDKPSMPDKNVRYVTDCESANSTENGIWTSSNTYFTTDYKTEGLGSAAIRVTNQETVSMNAHRFLFSSTADLSKSKSFMFDLFVDDMDLASTCDFKVYISSDRRHSADNFVYYINTADLKLGWNSFDIPLSEFKQEVASDSPSWDNIQCVAFEPVLNTPFQDFGGLNEYFLMCVDNIRISESYTLQAETNEEEELDTTIPGGDDSESSERIENTVTLEAEVITLAPEENTTYVTQRVIKKQKVLIDTITAAHWIILIVTCCVSVILIVGSLVLVILSSRKGKRGGSN